MPDCNHPEADTRIVLHVADAVRHGHTSVLVVSIDTDVTVLLLAYLGELMSAGLTELYVRIGKGATVQVIDLVKVRASIGEPYAHALLGFHAFTGCDWVSGIVGYGKKSALKQFLSADPTPFSALRHVTDPEDLDTTGIEAFVAAAYRRPGSTLVEARAAMLREGISDIAYLPPGPDALRLHTLRAAYTASVLWGRATVPSNTDVSPVSWGWDRDAAPVWQSQDAAPLYKELAAKCRCKVGDCTKCKCVSLGGCIAACRCKCV